MPGIGLVIRKITIQFLRTLGNQKRLCMVKLMTCVLSVQIREHVSMEDFFIATLTDSDGVAMCSYALASFNSHCDLIIDTSMSQLLHPEWQGSIVF